MKNLNLEHHYINLEKHIKLFASYLDKPYYNNIIKSCRLTPFDFNIKDYKKNKLFYKWKDEYGNSLYLNKNKEIKIIYNDISIKNIIKTDIYQGLNIDKVFKISKNIFFLIGKDVDFNKNFIIISLLGIDNYLRTFMLYCDEWVQVSSLILGIDLIEFLFKNINNKSFKKVKIKKNFHLPCNVESAWLTSLPLMEEELKVVFQKNNLQYLISKGNNQ